jgi:hypothetical protein
MHDHVRADHHRMARQAVGDDPADEDERRLREPSGREDDAEIGLGAVQAVEHREREADRGHGGPEERRRAGGVEEPELPLAKGP